MITVVVMAVVTTELDDSSTILLVVLWLAVTSPIVVVEVGEMASCDVESEGGNSGPSFTIKQTDYHTHVWLYHIHKAYCLVSNNVTSKNTPIIYQTIVYSVLITSTYQ